MLVLALIGLIVLLIVLTRPKQRQDNSLADAEAYIREHTALYRHYCIPEVRRHVKQWAHVDLTDQEAVYIVQSIRDEKGMGPITDYNMPGYTSSEEEDEAVIAEIEKM